MVKAEYEESCLRHQGGRDQPVRVVLRTISIGRKEEGSVKEHQVRRIGQKIFTIIPIQQCRN